MTRPRSPLFFSLGVLLGIALNFPAQSALETKSGLRTSYVGDQACRSCHAEKVESYHHTAHFLTSRIADENSILGSFTPGENILKTLDPALRFEMEEKQIEKPGGLKEKAFFQTSILERPQGKSTHTERFDLIIGSGGKGQTYLYWKDGLLFELPVSYWRQMGWINSPGYPDGFAIFDRGVNPRCLECHATYFQTVPPEKNRYALENFALGIQCEKCHGPGRNHVEQEQSKPASSSAILNPAHFPRDRQMDLCAWCHSGLGRPVLPAFSYVPGDSLEKYLDLPLPNPNAPPDVHGNQVAMLKRSACYLGSDMTCLTCHDLHVVQHDPAQYSKICLNCHQPGSATFAKPTHRASAACIDCHLPLQETNIIVFDWKGTKLRPKVRSHWIKIYSAGNPVPSNP